MTQPSAKEAPERRRRIRPPLARRLRENAVRGVLFAVWVAAAIAAWTLYRSSPETQSVRAVAETIEYRVASETSARIADVPVAAGDTVRAGDLIAILDPAALTRELGVLSAELELRHAELAQRAASLGREQLIQERSFAAAVDGAEVALLQTRVERDAVRAELTAVRARERRQRTLVSQRVAAREELDQLEAERQVLTRRASLLDDAATELEGKLEGARARLGAFRAAGPADDAEDTEARLVLAPERAAVDLVRARLSELEARRERLLLRAPADGVVHRVALRAGDFAGAGEVIAVLRSLTPTRALAYIDDARAAQVQLGTRVVVADRTGNGTARTGRVVSLGAGLAPFPPQLQNTPNQELWGREVVIALDDTPADTVSIAPGQILDVRFEAIGAAGDTAVAVAHPTTPAAPGVRADARPMDVPPALRRLTRIEPSALVWSASHDRFLVASDDTGWPDRDDHAPWLLRMDATGHLDPVPEVIADLRALNDVESLSWLDDGRLLALSSQSTSKRGRRPASRTLLVAAQPSDGGLRAVSTVSLLDAISAGVSPAGRAALGLRAMADGGLDSRLDIEGMTVMDGALLLGLKAPLDDRDCALLWRLAAPARLLETGRLDTDQLARFGSVCLQTEDGVGAAGGISDLLALPDGGLLVLSTDVPGSAATDEPPAGGAAWVIPKAALAAGGGAALPARLLRRFEGIKPEGAALAPDGQTILIVFDRGSDAPQWTTLPVSATRRAGGGRTPSDADPHVAVQ